MTAKIASKKSSTGATIITALFLVSIFTIVWTSKNSEEPTEGNTVTFIANVEKSGVVQLNMKITSRKTSKVYYSNSVSADTTYTNTVPLEPYDTYSVSYAGSLPIDNRRRELTLKIYVDKQEDDKVTIIARTGESKGAELYTLVLTK